MKAALVVMSILGCDDSGANCLPVATLTREWPTVAQCDLASEKELRAYQNIRYPMVVAVCQTAGTTALDDSRADAAEIALDGVSPTPPDTTKLEKAGLTGKAVAMVRHVLPSRKDLKSVIDKPVRIVSGTYSWVARKISF